MGIEAAHGKFVIIGDSDDGYDFGSLDDFIEKLEAGYDLVVGDRFEGGIKDGAMPPLHRYFANPLLTAIGRIVYGVPSTISAAVCADFAERQYCNWGFTLPAWNSPSR